MRAPLLRVLPIFVILALVCGSGSFAAEYTINTNPDATDYTLNAGDTLTAGLTATHSGTLTIGGNSTVSTGANTLTSSGAITGTAGTTITKTGTGTWSISAANENFNSSIDLQEGTLHVTNRYSIGNVNVNIGENATFEVNRLNSQNGTAVSDYVGTISGTGTLKLTSVGNWMSSNGSNPTQFLSTYMNDFTGTLWLSGSSNGSRFRIGSAGDMEIVNRLKLIKIDGNGEFWNATTNAVNIDFDLNGFGASDGTKRGAIRIDSNQTYNGTFTLSGNSSIGFCSVSGRTATFNNTIATNGYTLQLGTTIPNTAEGNFCTFYLNGDVTSGGTLGTIEVPKTQLNGAAGGNVKLVVGNSSAADSPVTQTINANIAYSGAWASGVHTLTFQPGANRTIEVKGVISGEGSLTKTGAGTLVLSGANTYQGATSITAGTVKVTKAGGLGTNTVDIAEDATLIWNAANTGSTLVTNFTNQFTGTGTIRLDNLGNFMTTTGASALSNYMTGFNGTLTVGSGTRFRLDQGANDAAGLANVKEIIVEEGGQFWIQSNGATIAPKIILGSTKWVTEPGVPGGIRLSNTFSATGGMELSADSAMGFIYTSNPVATFSGGLETNGHTLAIRNYASPAYGTVVLSGPISSGTATAPANYGKIQVNVNQACTLKFTADTREGFATTQALNVNIAMDTNPLVFDVADGYTLQLNGNLTGSGTITKNGTGTLLITQSNAQESGAVTLNAGTTKVTAVSGLGTGTVNIAEDATLIWNAANPKNNSGASLPVNFTNQFTGTGTLRLDELNNFMTTSADVALSNYLTGFKGTLVIGDGTRVRLDRGASDAAGLANVKEIVVEPGGQFWLNANSYEISTNLTLAGKGWNNKGWDTPENPYGAMRMTNNFKINGALTLADDTELNFVGACTANFAGGTEMNGHSLRIYGGSAGTAVFGGPIASTGGALGTINFEATNSTLKFTSMPSDTKTQAIDANINAAARPVIFAPEADYTLQPNGTLTSTGTVTKEGAGTLVFTNSQTLGTLAVSDGTLKINDGTTLTVNSVTLAPQALLNLKLSSEAANTPLMAVNGTLTSNSLEGEIAFSKDADTTIQAGDSFLLMTAAGMSEGDFSNLNFAASNDSLIDFPGGVWNYTLQPLGNGVGIFATAQLENTVPEPSAWLLLALGAFFLLKRKK